MKKLQSLQKYLTCFFLFGQSTYYSLTDANKKYIPIFYFVPQTVFLLVILTRLTFVFNRARDLSNFELLNVTILGLDIPYIYVVIFENIFQQNAARDILKSFAWLIEYFERFQMKPCAIIKLGIFNKRFLKKFGCVVLGNATFFSFKLIITYTPHSFIQQFDILTALMFIYKCFSALHISFFIDLMGFLLSSLNSKLKNCGENVCFYPTKSLNEKRLLRILKFTRNYHLKCYQVTKQINKRFGYLLIVYMLQSAASCISNLILTFHFSQMTTDSSNLTITRKYELRTQLCSHFYFQL